MPELTDVVIVGAGLLGLALAYELSRRTLRVVVLEAVRPGTGATGTGFAWVNATSKRENEPYHRLNAQGLTHYGQLAAEHGADLLGIHSGGSLFWCAPEDTSGIAELNRRASVLHDWQYPASMLHRAEMQALEPHIDFPVDAEGLLAPADLWIDTPRLVRFFVDSAVRNKVELRRHCPATGFTRDITGAISTVETPEGRIATRLLVLAAGVETPTLAALAAGDPLASEHCPVRREPGLLIQTAPDSAPGSAHRVLYPPDHGGLHFRPTSDGGLLIGADDTDSISPTADLQQATADLLGRVARALPTLRADAATLHAEARICVRPVPQDGYPVVGPLPGVKGAYVMVTHSGITLGPLLAQLLAEEIVVGHSLPLLRPFRPSRFVKDSDSTSH